MGADHAHHKETFITKYIFSQDHKMIAKQYLITGLIMGIIGIAMSLLFRLQLAWPEKSFWVFETFLGKWAPEGVMDPNVYLALVTIHGTLMVFFVLTAGLSGTFSNLLIPLQIGARDMASGLLNMISYWLFFLSSVIMIASLFVESGPAAAGWTIYPPLSALPQAQPGSGLGMTLWLVSMAIFIASSLLGSLNYIVTVINLRTKGMSMTRLPLTIWAFFVTAIIGVVSFPVLLSAALLLIMDRSFGTSFFLSDIFIQGEVLHLLRVRLEIGPSDIGEWVPARLGASEEEAAAFAFGTTLGVAGVKAHLKRVSLFTRLLRGNTNLSCS